ncbi:DUF6587 family protein [Vulcaniibacterium gelatinicum]|uniref:DUF6587 family protein n=1 Tax=Vulcaniibacterium gelatinicum TaxID=2598725 RepID=UPI0011CA5E04|nr:DUF6587 family protein [Vulcaniibacterium gelatinicum]
MDGLLLLQYVVIGLAVAASALYVVRRQFPNAVRALRLACAAPLVRERRAPWLRALGRRIAPAPKLAGEGTCGGCNKCG